MGSALGTLFSNKVPVKPLPTATPTALKVPKGPLQTSAVPLPTLATQQFNAQQTPPVTPGAPGMPGSLQPLTGQNLADAMLSHDPHADPAAVLAARQRLEQATGGLAAQYINAYGAGGQFYSPQTIVDARQAALQARHGGTGQGGDGSGLGANGVPDPIGGGPRAPTPVGDSFPTVSPLPTIPANTPSTPLAQTTTPAAIPTLPPVQTAVAYKPPIAPIAQVGHASALNYAETPHSVLPTSAYPQIANASGPGGQPYSVMPKANPQGGMPGLVNAMAYPRVQSSLQTNGFTSPGTQLAGGGVFKPLGK